MICTTITQRWRSSEGQAELRRWGQISETENLVNTILPDRKNGHFLYLVYTFTIGQEKIVPFLVEIIIYCLNYETKKNL